MSTKSKCDHFFWKKRRPMLNATGDDDNIHYDDIHNIEYDDYDDDYNDFYENNEGDPKCNEEKKIINTSSSSSVGSLLLDHQRDEMSIDDDITISDEFVLPVEEMDVVDGIFMGSRDNIQSLSSNGRGVSVVDDSSFSVISTMMEEEDNDWDVITATTTMNTDDILISAPTKNSKHNDVESFSIATCKGNDSEWDALSSIQSVISIGDMDHETHMMISSSSSSSVDYYGLSYKDILTKSKIMSHQTHKLKHDDDYYVENLNATTIVKNDVFMPPIVEVEEEEDCCVSLNNNYLFDERDGYKFGRGGKNPYKFRRKKKKSKTMTTSKR